jgi:glycine betaine/proline transport system substrate-binding protein
VVGKMANGRESLVRQAISRRDFLKLSGTGLIGAGLLGVAGCGGTGAGSSGSKELKIGINAGWIESTAVSALTKVLLERDLGYETVELQNLEMGPLFQSVATGDLDAFQDLWLPATHKPYWEEVKNDVVHIEPWYKGEVNLGLAVPNYVEAQSIPDLNQYRSEFGGRIVGIEPGAGEMQIVENDVIPGYNLNYELIPSSTPAMLAELQRAINEKAAVVVTAWKPHPMFIDYPIRYLEDPEGLMGGEENISTITREGLREDLPDAFALLDAVTLNEEQLLTLEVSIRNRGEDTPEKGTEAWLQDNRSVVQPWIDAAKEAQKG